MDFMDGKRRWTVSFGYGCTGLSEWTIRSPCVCGGSLKARIGCRVLQRDPPEHAECGRSGCHARVRIPREVAEHTLGAARKSADEAQGIRAASGGPRGMIPI